MKLNLYFRFFLWLGIIMVQTQFALAQWEFIGSPDACRPMELDQEGDTIVLLTGAGIYFSEDNAETWDPIDGPPGIALIRTLQIENGSLYVNVNTSTKYQSQKVVLTEVFRSDDWGQSWNLITQSLDSARAFRAILLQDDRVCYFGKDSLYISFDKGASFSIVNPTPAFNATYYQHADVLFAQVNQIGSFHHALLSSDNLGSSWDTIYKAEPYVLIDQIKTIDQVLWKLEHDQPAVAARVAKSYDKGQTWIDLTPVPLEHGDVRLDGMVGDTHHLYIASSFSGLDLTHSADGGLSWSAAIHNASARVPLFTHGKLLFPNSNGLFLSGDHSETLTPIGTGFEASTVTHLAIFESDLLTTGNERVHRQNNGGTDWIEMPGFIHMENTRNGTLLAMNDHTAFVSSDGIAWDTISAEDLGQPSPTRIFRISCLDNMMYVYDLDDGLFYSADFGGTWHSSGVDLVRVFNYNGKYMIQHDVDVIAVSDNGIDWEDLPDLNWPGPYFSAEDLEWLDPYYFFCQDTLMLRIHKDSTTWELVRVPFDTLTKAPAPGINTFSMLASEQALFLAWYGQGVLVSFDYGDTWTRINEGLTNQRASAISIFNDDLVLGVEGGVWRRALSDIITSTQEIHNDLVFTASPNPASDVIKVSLPGGINDEAVFYALYNAQGLLVKQVSSSANSTAEISLSDIIPGIYFLHGQTDGREGWIKVVKQ